MNIGERCARGQEVLWEMVRERDSTISSQGARIAELENFVKLVDMGGYKNYINIKLAAKHLKEAQP